MRRNRGFVGVSSCVHFLFSSPPFFFERFEVTVVFLPPSTSTVLPSFSLLPFLPNSFSFRDYSTRTPPAGVSNKREKNASHKTQFRNFRHAPDNRTERNGLLVQAKTDVIAQSIIFFRSFAFSDYFINLLSRDRRPSVISFHSPRCDRNCKTCARSGYHAFQERHLHLHRRIYITTYGSSGHVSVHIYTLHSSRFTRRRAAGPCIIQYFSIKT